MPAVDAIQTHPLHRPGKPPRLIAELSPRDGAAWRSVGLRIAAASGGRLSTGVYPTACCLDQEGRLRLRHRLRSARTAAERLSTSGPVLRTDVRAFYPSVTSGALHGALVRAGAKADDARDAAEMVEGWAERGHQGLPIGPPASAAVADAVLISVDAALEGRPFLRWVDDYLIAVRDEAEASRVGDQIDEALAALGLERSEPKTRFISRRDAGPWPGSLSPGVEVRAVSRRAGP